MRVLGEDLVRVLSAHSAPRTVDGGPAIDVDADELAEWGCSAPYNEQAARARRSTKAAHKRYFNSSTQRRLRGCGRIFLQEKVATGQQAETRETACTSVHVNAGNRRTAQAGLSATCRFLEGDVCHLAGIENKSFDRVISIFGAMFAPRPFDVAQEMVRVTRPGGRIVMGNWIPNGPTLVAQILKISASYSPPPPEGFVSPMAWGSTNHVIERFGDAQREATWNPSGLRECLNKSTNHAVGR